MLEAGNIIQEIIGRKNRLFLKYTWEQLVRKTPVDTYTAANSWFVTSQAPSTKRPQYGPFYGFKRPTTPPYLLNDLAFKFKFIGGTHWFITNNQPYIEYLERGHSGQQPDPWIRPTVSTAVKLANVGAFS